MNRRIDRSLINRIVAGEKEEFSLVVEEYQQRVYGMIYRQVGEPTVAEDLTQQTFLKVFRNLHRFRHEADLGTWVVRIALNETSSYFGSKAYRQRKRSESFDPAKHDRAENTGNDQIFRFQKALALLKPIHRDVLVLVSLEGRTYEEVASLLRIPIGTVRSRLNAARLSLSRLLLEKGSHEEE